MPRPTKSRRRAQARVNTTHVIVAAASNRPPEPIPEAVVPPARGRPRELPAQLPVLGSLIAVDPQLESIVPRSRASLVAAQRNEQRVAKNAAIAEAQARQRGRRQVEQLAMAVQHARLKADKDLARLQDQVRRREEEAREMNQLRLRLEAGQDVVLTAALKRKVHLLGGYGAKKPHINVADHRVIMELAGDKTQVDIAARIGVAQSTVSRHIHKSDHLREPGERRGRKPSLTPAMLSAAARFQFLFGTRSLQDTAAFLRFVYRVSVSTKTISRNLNTQCGFRRGDFRRYRSERNSQRSIDERYTYATTLPTKYGHENSHRGDEVGLCPLLEDHVEALLDTYLPHCYEEFTPQRCAMVERIFGCQRLTLEVVREALHPSDGVPYVDGADIIHEHSPDAEDHEEIVRV